MIKGDDPFPKDYDWLYFDSEETNFHRVGVQTRFSREASKMDYIYFVAKLLWIMMKSVILIP